LRSLIALSLLLIAVAATVSAVRPGTGFAAGADTSTDLAITQTGSPPTQDITAGTPFKDITWTMVVTNNGPLDDTNVTISDPMPTGATYVNFTTTQGTCAAGASLDCSLGTLPAGGSLTITLVTTPTEEGQLTNTAVVAGDVSENNPANNTATASVIDAYHRCCPRCTALLVKPKQLLAGRLNTVHIRVTAGRLAVPGVRVRLKGPGILVVTRPSGTLGNITRTIKPSKPGVVFLRPLAVFPCTLERVGVAAANISVTG
jgi:uncharacterized repeat protein (TIGR01451 family)